MLNILTGETKLQETHEGEHNVLESCSEKYMGQLLSCDGSNVKNVENRANKGICMAGTIQSTLTNVPGGKFHFEIAVMMRHAYLISSMLSYCEVWYNITEVELRKLERVDETLLITF